MARADAAEMSDDRAAGEIKIAKGVEQLVADELVSIAQPAIVPHAAAADHHHLVQPTAARRAGGMRARHIAQETKGARGGELGFEALRVHPHQLVLAADQRISEIYLEAHREDVIG